MYGMTLHQQNSQHMLPVGDIVFSIIKPNSHCSVVLYNKSYLCIGTLGISSLAVSVSRMWANIH